MDASPRIKPAVPVLLAVVALITGCAEAPQRYSLASRCFYAATVAAEVKPVEDETVALCDHALVTISLSQHDKAATLTNRGILRLGLAAYDQAKEDFDQAIQLVPDLGESYVNRGAVLLAMHRYTEAIADLDRGIELNSSSIEKAYYNRAIAREMIHDVKGAYHDYLKASQLRPGWGLPKRDLQRFKVTFRSRLA